MIQLRVPSMMLLLVSGGVIQLVMYFGNAPLSLQMTAFIADPTAKFIHISDRGQDPWCATVEHHHFHTIDE